MKFIVQKNLSKEKAKLKRKEFFLNTYKKEKKNFLNNANEKNFSNLQKILSKLVKINVFHRNKSSRLVSRYNKLVLQNGN